jgi:hypothetical protein
MKSFNSRLSAALLTAALVLVPALSSANTGKNSHDDYQKTDVRASVGCTQAWGQFFTFSWLRGNHKFDFNFNRNCFGFGTKATTTPDTIAPIISNLKTNAKDHYALISWTTDENADSAIFISTTSPVSTSAAPNSTKSDKTKTHSVVVGNLLAGNTYYLVVRSKDKAGNTSYSSQISFVTTGTTTPSDTAAPVISNVTTAAGPASISISWTTNEPSTSKVYYATGSSVDANASTTLAASDNALVTSHSLTIGNLSTSTLYSMIVESKDSSLNRALGSLFSITTLAN